MDIQFVLDPYSCVSYIVSYISKGQRGLSNLLHAACQEASETETDIRQQVRKVGNQFLSSVEIGAQEAVYLVLQMPLRRCTRTIVYVDTNKSDARTSLLKPLSELKELPKNSTKVEMDSVLKRYKRRPRSMEKLCYADFASWYDLCPKKKSMQTRQMDNLEIEQELPETEYRFDEADDLTSDEEEMKKSKEVKLLCGTLVRRRVHQKVIYSHCTSMNDNKEEHYRQKLMLFSNWRDEEKDLIAGYHCYEESYQGKIEEIAANEMSYDRIPPDIYQKMYESFDNDIVSSDINPEGQHQEAIDEDDVPLPMQTSFFDPESIPGEYDIGQDLGIGRKQANTEILPQKEIDNDQYLLLVQNLNVEQKTFFYHILHKLKIHSLPFYTFLSGGAGVGKSVVIRALYQAMLKYLNHRRTSNPDSTKLLLCAPTGKAAYNIAGRTIHSAFQIPVSQGFKYKPLDSQQLEHFRAHYHDLKIVIIDEISMVGRSMFNFINLRLQEIMGCTKPFGNVSILAVGDLFQLKPVMDSWIFSQMYISPQLCSLAVNPWVDLFDFYELNHIMRQRDDFAFAQLLNRMREGKHTKIDMDVLKARHVETLALNMEDLAAIPHLFCTRQDVQAHNNFVLENCMKERLITIEAVDEISGDIDGFEEKNPNKNSRRSQ